MGMLVVARVDVVAVAVEARRGRVEVDAGGLDRRLGLGCARRLRVVARRLAPRPHRPAAAMVGRSRYACTHRV